jgi:adenylate cyclase
LRRAEFIQELSLFPVAEYAFRHPLTQEVASAGMLKDRRRQTQASVAKVIEAHDVDHLDERSALLAHHWEEAGEVLAAARWHARAAQWAGLTNAAEALRHWQSARRLLRDAPQTGETVQFGVAACMGALGLSWRLGTPKEEITEVFEEGLKLAAASNDITAQAALNGIYGCFLGLVEGWSDEYCRYAGEAIRLAEQTDDQGLQIAQRAFFGFGTVLAGRLKEGLASCEWAFEHLPADPELGKVYSGYSPYLGLLDVYAWILVRSGRIPEGRAAIAKVEALARECGDFEILTWLGLPNSEMAVACADAEAARAYAATSLMFGERSATPQSRMVGVASHGAACRLEGRWDAAVAASGEAVQLAVAGANREFEGWVRAELALALLGKGDIDGAEREAELAAEVARSQPSRFDEVRGHLAFIRTQLARGGEQALARADISLKRAQSLTDEFEINVYLAELHECRAGMALARGDAATAQQELEQARQSYGKMGATFQLDRLAREFA